MKKSNKILFPILGIFIVGIITVLFFFNKPVDIAILYIDQGEVLIDSGKGFKLAVDEMTLKENYKVKTSANSLALIVFFESDILRLEENTEVNLQELSDTHVSLKQDSGETWNKVLRLTGKETYEVETPNSVATVRGTGFAVKIGDEESIIVGDGAVSVKSKIDGTIREILANRKARIIEGRLEELDISANDRQIIERNNELDLERLKEIRQKIISNNKVIFEIVKKTQGWTDADVKRYLEEVDKRKHDVDELTEKSPVRVEALDKLVRITKEIQRQTITTRAITNNEKNK